MTLNFFETGMGNKKHILIIHGWASNKERFRPLARQLAKHGWYVIAVDLPGFGQTPAPKIPLTLAGYTTAVRDLTREVFNGKSYIVFGHSFGGRIAARLAKVDKNIRGLVLCAPGVGTMDPVIRLLYKIISRVLLFFPFIRRVVLENYYSRSSGLVRLVLRGITTEDPKKTFGGIKVPTLILWGAKDKIVSLDKAELLKELIPRSLIRTFPKIGHSLPYYRGANIAKEITTWSNTFVSN